MLSSASYRNACSPGHGGYTAFTLADMSDRIDPKIFEVRKRHLKLLMAMMLLFMIAAPLLAPVIWPDEFSRLKGPGLYFFYIGTPTVFGGLFVQNLILYRRWVRKNKDTP
jgi:hypothetical protein